MMNLGDAYVILGIQFFRDRSRDILGLSHTSKCLTCILACTCSKGDKRSKFRCPQNDIQ